MTTSAEDREATMIALMERGYWFKKQAKNDWRWGHMNQMNNKGARTYEEILFNLVERVKI